MPKPRNKIKQISYGFYAPEQYKLDGYSGTDYRDAVEKLFPLFWKEIPASRKKELMDKYPTQFDALDLRYPEADA